MQRKTTKEILADSFMELTAAKPANKITIANIVENCGMTQPTFYRYFKDKFDLIAWIYVREAQNNVDRIGSGGYLWRDTLMDGMRYFAENRQYITNVLKHTNGRDSFINQMTGMNIEYIVNEVRKKLMVEKIPDELLSLAKMYCYGTGQFLCEWPVQNMPMSYEKVAEMMESAIPEPLKPYLCE